MQVLTKTRSLYFSLLVYLLLEIVVLIIAIIFVANGNDSAALNTFSILILTSVIGGAFFSVNIKKMSKMIKIESDSK